MLETYISRDLMAAIDYFNLAANQGIAEAQHRLAISTRLSKCEAFS
jgi:TPR repeat protein